MKQHSAQLQVATKNNLLSIIFNLENPRIGPSKSLDFGIGKKAEIPDPIHVTLRYRYFDLCSTGLPFYLQ